MKKKLDYIREHNWTMLLLGILVGLIISATGIYAATLVDSANVVYDNTASSLSSSDVQNALDELYKACKGNTLVDTVTNLFNNATQTSVTTTGSEAITQATSVGLMEDSDGNIRYYGASPDNYVSFNDELWRIIGVFDVEDEDGNTERRVKIVRDESIGTFAYDNKSSGKGTSTSSYGSNDWSDARLMMLLNPGYEDGATDSSGTTIYSYTGSLYWNSGSGTCYSGSSNGTKSCDFTSTGLGDEAKSLIGQAVYYLGGSSSYSGLYADDYYSFERGTTVYSGHATEWTGYVGLIYPSDYGYASDLSVCTLVVGSYSSSTTNCTGTNWLFKSDYMWLISNNVGGSARVNGVTNTGYVGYSSATYERGVYPTVYLKASVKLASGTGTSDDPYILG